MSQNNCFDEMWGHSLSPGQTQSMGQGPSQTQYQGLRSPYAPFDGWFQNEDPARLRRKQREAEEVFRLTGITFNVYGRSEAAERLIPFDIIPRIISGREWSRLARGIEQRVRAINAFLHDIYHQIGRAHV